MIYTLCGIAVVLLICFFTWLGHEAGRCQGWIECESNYEPVLRRWREDVLGKGRSGKTLSIMVAEDKDDRTLIDAFFRHPTIVTNMNLELGFSGRVAIDWEGRTVIAAGTKGTKTWNLDEILADLRKSKS